MVNFDITKVNSVSMFNSKTGEELDLGNCTNMTTRLDEIPLSTKKNSLYQ